MAIDQAAIFKLAVRMGWHAVYALYSTRHGIYSHKYNLFS